MKIKKSTVMTQNKENDMRGSKFSIIIALKKYINTLKI